MGILVEDDKPKGENEDLFIREVEMPELEDLVITEEEMPELEYVQGLSQTANYFVQKMHLLDHLQYIVHLKTLNLNKLK